MNKRFSFRAWHYTHKEMIPNNNQGFEGDVFNWLHEGKDIEIMQFTGLKDNLFEDIYEGDIVSDHVGIGAVEYSEKHAGFRVNYRNGQCKWFYDYILNGERESIRRIGNIYENPEFIGDS